MSWVLCPGFIDEDGQKGCFDEPPAAGCVNSLRALPYNVPGCFAGDRNPASTRKAPNPPPCDPLKESNAYCVQECIDWAPRIPEIGSSSATFYVATQAGYACFCGAEEHAQRYVTDANKVTDAACNNPCGCPANGCPAGTGGTGSAGPSPAGKAGEMCGGGWRNTTMRVSCGFQWGAYFLIAFSLSSAFYLGAGILGPWRRGSSGGLTAKQALAVHPHYHRWVELAGLVADGAAYAKARRLGKAPPPGRQRQHCNQNLGETGGEGERKLKEKQKDKRRSSSSNKSKSRTSREADPNLEEALVGHAQSGSMTGDIPSVAGTASAGGGRWVHIPN